MDTKELFQSMPGEDLVVLAEEVLEVAKARELAIPSLVGSVTVAETAAVEELPVPTESSETAAPERAPLSAESLLATFDTAYQTYSSLVDTSNAQRAEVKGRKKPEQLEATDANTVKADVEAILATPGVLEELQAEVDFFTRNPEVDSPEAGFDLVIVPEDLTATDEQAIAKNVQTKITTQYSPYIRSEAYNDKRTPAVTGKGYRVAFAPRHYNVPKGTANQQTNWMNAKNQATVATELQTATDGEALAQISNLGANGELNDPDTRFDRTYFKRFDQAPLGGFVSNVRVNGFGGLFLGESRVRNGGSARALVVPKA